MINAHLIVQWGGYLYKLRLSIIISRKKIKGIERWSQGKRI